ncbi:MAG: hypothetical protein R2708_21720 [Vicinamibacterales bacterium]
MTLFRRTTTAGVVAVALPLAGALLAAQTPRPGPSAAVAPGPAAVAEAAMRGRQRGGRARGARADVNAARATA